MKNIIKETFGIIHIGNTAQLAWVLTGVAFFPKFQSTGLSSCMVFLCVQMGLRINVSRVRPVKKTRSGSRATWVVSPPQLVKATHHM